MTAGSCGSTASAALETNAYANRVTACMGRTVARRSQADFKSWAGGAMDAHGARGPSGRGEPARRAVNAEPELSQRQGAVLVVVERERDVVLGVRRRATLSDRDREAVQAFGVDELRHHHTVAMDHALPANP